MIWRNFVLWLFFILFPPKDSSWSFSPLCVSYLWCDYLYVFSLYVNGCLLPSKHEMESDLEEPAFIEGLTLESLLKPSPLWADPLTPAFLH